MNPQEQERIEQNVRRTAGIHALRKIRGIVDEDLKKEAARAKLLHALLRYGWIALLLAALLLARYLGVI
ncbi:MAG: hypothetical protein KGJ19_05125 [Betaproteobacteria bacterium]|nr:hypothetical protein [Betaproteobacteria bacterium]